MPPSGGKGKGKGRDNRSSRSRNTTPSSVVSAGANMGSNTAYLDIPITSLMVPTNITYDDILERHGGGGGIPDPKHLEALAADLKTLSMLAETRGKACYKGMSELAARRKDRLLEGEREKERVRREADEKEKMRKDAEELDDRSGKKGSKIKKIKERSVVREERPLTHGAHGVARQDGVDTQMTGTWTKVGFTYFIEQAPSFSMGLET